MSKQKLTLFTPVVFLMAIMSLSFFGCSSKSTLDTTTPNDSQMTITASPTSLNTNQTSVVEATVAVAGNGVSSQVVRFTVTPASAGTFNPEYDTTGADGVAATIFTASASGAAVIQASVNGTTISSSINMAVADAGQGGGSGNINVTVSRSLLLANGQDSSVVTVIVTDDVGQPAPDSTLIRVAAGEKFIDIDGNGYWSDGIDSLVFDANGNGTWDPMGLIPSTSWTSGGNGTATINYVSGDDAYTVYVKVTVDDGGIFGTADVSIQLSPNATLSYIFLASDSLSLSVKATGGIEIGTLRATGYDVNGNTVPEGMQIVFVILDGPGGGEELDQVAYGPDTAVTNSQGIATTTLHSGTISGTVRIRAYAGTILSNASLTLIAAGPPAHIVVGAFGCNVPLWDDVGKYNEITAVVSDVYLNPVNDSTVVYFRTDEGTMMSHINRTDLGEGIARSRWIAGTNVPTADGRVYIYAETAGGTVADTSMFFNTHYVDTLIIYGWPSRMRADPNVDVMVTVIGLDLNDNPVVGGTKFEGEGNHLDIGSGILEDGCYSSSTRIKIRSSSLTEDYSMTGGTDDGIGAVEISGFWAGLRNTVYPCTLTTGPAYGQMSSMTGQAAAVYGEEVNFDVEIKDRSGNPLGDHTLVMTASGGVVVGATKNTNSHGEAFGFTWIAPAVDGSYAVKITDTDPLGNGLVMSINVSVAAP